MSLGVDREGLAERVGGRWGGVDEEEVLGVLARSKRGRGCNTAP